LPRDRESARDVELDLEAGRSLRNGVLRPRAALGKTGSQVHLQPWQYRWVLRLRKILRGDLAEQTRTERRGISERLRSGHNVQAVGFGCIKKASGPTWSISQVPYVPAVFASREDGGRPSHPRRAHHGGEVKRLGVLLLLVAISSAHGDTCVDAVKITKEAVHELNARWFSVCVTASRDERGKKRCIDVHDIYEKAFK